jgi:3-oxoacyl-(acyl-carrier-protein) synthase
LSKHERVFVTGLGVVSPYGKGVDLFWDSLAAGKKAFKEITTFDASPFRNTSAGEVSDFEPLKSYSRSVSFLLAALEEALSSASIESIEGLDCAFSAGTNFSGINGSLSQFKKLADKPGEVNVDNSAFYEGEEAVVKEAGFKGDFRILSLSCASGTAAIGQGFDLIREGRETQVVAAGFDELSLYSYAGLSALRAITKDTVKPFHRERSGTLFAEGAGVFILESESSLNKRQVEPIVEIHGYGVNNDAYHMTAPEKDGKGIQRVMEMALAEAGLRPAEINHINCHATATKYNDLIETKAVKNVFENHAYDMVLTANKSCFGHAMGAAGALEAVSAVKSVTDNLIPPTLELDDQDPELDLDYCALKSRDFDVKYAMTNSYGLGGANSSLIISKIL